MKRLRMQQYSAWMLVLFSFQWVNAQSSKLEFSLGRSIPRTEQITQLILIEDSIPAVVSKYGESILIRKFDHQVEDERPELLYSDTERTLNAFRIHGSTMHILSSAHEPNRKDYTLSQILISRDSVRKLETTHFRLSKSAELNKNLLFFSLSKRGSNIVICQQSAFNRGEKAVINMFINLPDTSMTYHLPSAFDSDDLELLGASIDERGTVYFAAKTGIKLNTPFRKKHLVYSFDPKEKVLTEFDLSSDAFFIQDMIISTADSGFYISTLYATDPLAQERSNGYSFIQSSDDGREITKRLGGSFTPQMIQAHQRDDDETDSYISDLFMLNTISLNGAQLVVMEKRFHDQICTADPSTGIMTCTDQYHYNAITFENPLNPAKSVTVPKRQLDYDKPSPFCSQAILTTDTEVWMFYNDHFRNEGLNGAKIMNNPSRSVIRLVRIAASGEVQSTVLNQDRQNDFVFVANVGVVANDHSAFLLAKDGDQHRVEKIDFSVLLKPSKANN